MRRKTNVSAINWSIGAIAIRHLTGKMLVHHFSTYRNEFAQLICSINLLFSVTADIHKRPPSKPVSALKTKAAMKEKLTIDAVHKKGTVTLDWNSMKLVCVTYMIRPIE